MVGIVGANNGTPLITPAWKSTAYRAWRLHTAFSNGNLGLNIPNFETNMGNSFRDYPMAQDGTLQTLVDTDNPVLLTGALCVGTPVYTQSKAGNFEIQFIEKSSGTTVYNLIASITGVAAATAMYGFIAGFVEPADNIPELSDDKNMAITAGCLFNGLTVKVKFELNSGNYNSWTRKLFLTAIGLDN